MIRPRKTPGALCVLAAGFLGVACVGTVGGDSAPGAGGKETGGDGKPSGTGGPEPGNRPPTGNEQPPINPGEITPENSAGPAIFRRLTIAEYNNTIKDLLGVEANRVKFAVDSATPVGYLAGAAITNSVDAQAVLDSSQQLAAAVGEKMAALLPNNCLAPTAAAEQKSCAEQFIGEFGLRAFRRPVTDEEKTDLVALYDALSAAGVGSSYQEAILGLVSGMLQSPNFLYRWEVTPAAASDLAQLDSFAIASRLSYLLWATMPDEALFDAAKAEGLKTPAQIADQTRRMLADAKFVQGLTQFHYQWLGIDGLEQLPKDESYTNYSAETAKSMLDETIRFAQSILAEAGGSGKLEDLFTSNQSFIDERLAKVYGMAGGGQTLAAAQLDPSQRAGILTQGSFLSAHADPDLTNPVKRGVVILKNVLCQEVPSPDGLDIPVLPERQPGQTTREHFARHSSDAFCGGCHQSIDALGFAFEHYDAIGAYREMEENKPVDASGTLRLDSGEFSFDNAVEMVNGLVKTPELQACMARQWMRYLFRRDTLKAEAGSVNAALEAMTRSQNDLREMLVALTQTRAFTHRKPLEGEGMQ